MLRFNAVACRKSFDSPELDETYRHSRCYSLSPETLLCLLRDYITTLGKNSNIVFIVSAAVTVDIARERPTQKLSNKQVC